jgi:flagellar basal body-associated protein FliL
MAPAVSPIVIVPTAAIIIMVLLGIAALVGGTVIALLASRNAPDGFEDQEGFHLGRLPPAAPRKEIGAGSRISAENSRGPGTERGPRLPGTNGPDSGPFGRTTMSIEKESSGLPEVNVHKRTTKVNLSIVIGVAVFFAAMFGLVGWFWFSRG